ncbi:BLUF domain-containing protein [Thalassotalea euphylliae]|uniref:BLUF domain-containing protein n=1 Tax=Thalassotalea euphylliae TaxID=1655234 RepID=A0A3E0TR15_9GAMM|nr:BLUF domain-containing protein [Thalassotalea euphylliae]REL27091.1 BLUF domain-containing protein [Thalassotalea euphylliae]
MYLVRLIYASCKPRDIVDESINDILVSARKHNTANSITGLLCFNRKYFLQCLEGSRKKVNETYQRILQDDRHEKIIMLDYCEIVKREFTDWSMGYIPDSSLTHDINLKFSGSSEFDPFEMSGESAHQMMLELKEQVPVVD